MPSHPTVSQLKPVWIIALGALVALSLGMARYLTRENLPEVPGEVTWTMIQVNEDKQQADAHLLQLPDGKAFLIDVSHNGNLVLAALKTRGIQRIDKIIISHAHKDHYGGLEQLLASGIPIGEVAMNFPDKKRCDREAPWGCDFGHVSRLWKAIQAAHIPIERLVSGSALYAGRGVKLEVLYVFDGVHTPVGPTDINDTSALLRLTVGKVTTLFTGDLNETIGGYLAKYGKNLKAQVLKVPHHGTDSVAPNAFFDVVDPEVAMVSSPKPLWLSDRSRRVRTYFEGRKTRVYVAGRDGEVSIHYTPTGYRVLGGGAADGR